MGDFIILLLHLLGAFCIAVTGIVLLRGVLFLINLI